MSVHMENNKYSTGDQRDLHHLQQQQQQQHHYTTNRKPKGDQSPDNSILDRIPEYSEDIYPYATFHLPDHENMAGNPGRPTVAFPKSIRASAASSNSGHTTGRRKSSKPFKSESEEYDSLGSDTDTCSAEHGGGHPLEESVSFSGKWWSEELRGRGPEIIIPINSIYLFATGRSFSPGPRKEKLALFQKPTRHSKLVFSYQLDGHCGGPVIR